MKRLLTILILLALLAGTAYALTYGADNYRKNLQFLRGGGNNDPLYRFMTEVESVIFPAAGTGTIYYVDSKVSTEGTGISWSTAKNTLQEGIDLCTDNRGDFVYVAQDHAEDIATGTALDFDCPGMTIRGFGSGDEMPEISLTAQASKVGVSSPDVTVYNIRFLGEFAGGSTVGFDVAGTGDGLRILGCQFRENSDNEELLKMITVTTEAHRIVIVGNSFVGSAGGTGSSSSAIFIEGASDESVISDNHFYGDWSGYVIDASSATSTEMLVENNIIHNYDTGTGKTIAFETSSTGSIVGNKCYGNGSSYAIVADSMFVSPDNIAVQTEDAGAAVNYDTLLRAILADTGTSLVAAIAALDDTGYTGECQTNSTDTQAICLGLSGFGDDYFNTGWSLVWLYNQSSAGTYEGETIDITDYDSTTGTFTLNVSASEAITNLDEIYIRRVEELNLDDTTMLGTSGGTIWYVDSVRGATGDATGKTWENAHATVQDAEDDCAAGDIVYISDGHDEDIGALLMNIANVSFIGMGEGDARPLLTCDDSTDEITLDNAGITVKNIRMQAGADKVSYAIRVEDAGIGCTIENVAFIVAEGSGEEFEICVDVDAEADKLTVRNCTYYNTQATAADVDSFIDLSETAIQDTTIIGNTVFGDFVNGCIYWTTSVPLNLAIIDNVLSNTTSTKYCINGSGAATGVWVNNKLYSDSYSTMYEPGSLKAFGNTGTDTTDEQCIAIPLSAETSDVGKAADGSNLERLEYLQQLTNAALSFLDAGDGSVFYVNSSASGTTGVDWANAVNDLEEIQALLAGDAGEIVFIAPGHAETLGGAKAVDLDVADVTYIGLGVGKNKPTFTYDTNVDSIAIGADDVKIKNIYFWATVDAVASAIIVETGNKGFVIEDCWFESESTGTDEFIDTILIEGTASDNGLIKNCRFMGDPGTNAGLKASINFVDCDFLRIIGNEFSGDCGDAHIFNESAASNFIIIRDNIIYQGVLAGGLDTTPGISLYATTSGMIIDNYIACNVATPEDAIVADDCYLFNNYYTETESADGGSTLIGLTAGAPGSLFFVAIDVNCALIPNGTQSSAAITGAASGRLILENITIATDSTGFAGPTNIELTCDNVYGLTGANGILMLEAVTGLGANISWVIGDASSSELPCLLESGKKLFMHGDNGAGTGSKLQKVILWFRRIDAGATIVGLSPAPA